MIPIYALLFGSTAHGADNYKEVDKFIKFPCWQGERRRFDLEVYADEEFCSERRGCHLFIRKIIDRASMIFEAQFNVQLHIVGEIRDAGHKDCKWKHSEQPLYDRHADDFKRFGMRTKDERHVLVITGCVGKKADGLNTNLWSADSNVQWYYGVSTVFAKPSDADLDGNANLIAHEIGHSFNGQDFPIPTTGSGRKVGLMGGIPRPLSHHIQDYLSTLQFSYEQSRHDMCKSTSAVDRALLVRPYSLPLASETRPETRVFDKESYLLLDPIKQTVVEVNRKHPSMQKTVEDLDCFKHGEKLVGVIVDTISDVKSAIDCQKECDKYYECFYFNWYKTEDLCDLMNQPSLPDEKIGDVISGPASCFQGVVPKCDDTNTYDSDFCKCPGDDRICTKSKCLSDKAGDGEENKCPHIGCYCKNRVNDVGYGNCRVEWPKKKGLGCYIQTEYSCKDAKASSSKGQKGQYWSNDACKGACGKCSSMKQSPGDTVLCELELKTSSDPKKLCEKAGFVKENCQKSCCENLCAEEDKNSGPRTRRLQRLQRSPGEQQNPDAYLDASEVPLLIV